MMKLGIIGSRRRNTKEDKKIVLRCVLKLKPESIVTGDCPKGGDKFAREVGRLLNIPVDVKYKKDKDGNRLKYGVSKHTFITSCYRRNYEIAKELSKKKDRLFALVAPDRAGGTENTITYFKYLYDDWNERLIINKEE